MGHRRNILLIQTDEHHYDWLGFRGAPGLQTPHLDQLAREGAVTFNQAYTCSGVCLPSRASLMTGRYSLGHGSTSNEIAPLPAREPRLARLLQADGYATGYFGKTHFGGDDDDMLGEGWNESFIKKDYQAYLDDQAIDVKYPEKGGFTRRPARYWNFGASQIPNEHYFENVITDRAIDFIDNHAEESFACYVAAIAPHNPFTPPEPYAWMYDAADMQLLPRHAGELDGKPPPTRQWIEQNARYLNDDERREFLATIYGLVTMIDHNVGKLLAALDRHGLRDQTLIVFTSDHGDYATRHGILGKSWSMSDDLMRVPMLIACPEAQTPRQSEALVQTIDLTATFLDWAGLDVPEKMHGHSLLPLVRNEVDSVRDRVYAYDQFAYSADSQDMSMVRTSRWKYVESTGFAGELYDMQNDPLEQHNLAEDPVHDALCNELRRDLLQWALNHAGGFHKPEEAGYWIDETLFFDESQFCGERIVKGHEPIAAI